MKIKLSESMILYQIRRFLEDCDADDLARVAGELFGGKCSVSSDPEDVCYFFEPNDDYCGAFDKYDYL